MLRYKTETRPGLVALYDIRLGERVNSYNPGARTGLNMVVTTGAIWYVQSSSQIVAANKPTSGFLLAGCPSCRPTNSVKTLKGIQPNHLYIEIHLCRYFNCYFYRVVVQLRISMYVMYERQNGPTHNRRTQWSLSFTPSPSSLTPWMNEWMNESLLQGTTTIIVKVHSVEESKAQKVALTAALDKRNTIYTVLL